jgi:hypothetical protein
VIILFVEEWSGNQRLDLIIFTFYYRRTILALVLLNQDVTFIWKLLNLETRPVTVPLMLAIISKTSLNYYFVTYSVLSSLAWEVVTCFRLFLLDWGYSVGFFWGILVVWVNSSSSSSKNSFFRFFGNTLGFVLIEIAYLLAPSFNRSFPKAAFPKEWFKGSKHSVGFTVISLYINYSSSSSSSSQTKLYLLLFEVSAM